MAVDVTDLDLYTLDDRRELARDEWRAAIAAARAKHPYLARNPFGYSVTSHAQATAFLRERKFWSAIAYIPQFAGIDPESMGLGDQPSILSTEGDEHGRLRRLVAPAFTPKAADRLRPFMRSVVERLVDAVAGERRCELVADVCEPYPIPIVCELLGAPAEDWKLFSEWATDLLRIFNNDLANDLPRIRAARAHLDEYVGALVEERRRAPREDLLSDMIAITDAGGDRLSSGELMSMAQAVLVAGTDTTRNQLACTMALFVQHPEQWKLLVERPELAPRAVEESMRYLGAVRGTARVASEDVELDGVRYPQGTFVFPSFVAANFDDAVWPDADRFDITKEAPNTPHLTFGSGIHYCLGAWLARAELQEALPVLASRWPDLRLDGEITWKPQQFGIWGPASVPLAW